MEITSSEIREVITREDDFGHELRVSGVIRSHAGVGVIHGGTYVDTVSGKPRQFDFRCSLRKQDTVLHLSVECKNASCEAPVVVCGRKRVHEESFHTLIESRKGTFTKRGVVYQGLSSITREARGDESIYPPGAFVGKSLVRIKSDKKRYIAVPDADIYDKWSQALASAVDATHNACGLASDLDRPHVCSGILPIVVLPDGVLWQAMYDEDGQILIEPAKADACEFYVAREIQLGEGVWAHRFCFSHIHFFTLTGFDSFLAKMATETDMWRRVFTEKASEV